MKSVFKKENELQGILDRIGKVLTRMRKKKGFKSYADFADTHDLATIQYWRMEKGKANLTMKSLIKVLSIHKVSLEDFFCMIATEGESSLQSLREMKA